MEYRFRIAGVRIETTNGRTLFGESRLVGGTALSLHLGHRMSIAIDLFTDAAYGAIDFRKIDDYLRKVFPFVSPAKLQEPVAMGMSYIIGTTEKESFKLDIFYTTDPFVFPMINKEKYTWPQRKR